MANEIYSKSWWGAGVCDNEQNWGYIYHSYANCGAPRQQSFLEKFGEPISAYSLRNLTSDTEQYVVQVSNGEETFDLTEQGISEVQGKYETLKVVKWYDQAGNDETLLSVYNTAPYLIKDGTMFFENFKPTIHFDQGNKIGLATPLRPILDEIRTYNVTSYFPIQETGKFGNDILVATGKIPTPLIQWQKGNLKAMYLNMIQNGVSYSPEEGVFYFNNSIDKLNLYQVKTGLNAPINFEFGSTTNMNISEFILYPDEDENINEVSENIQQYYSIENALKKGK